MSGGMLDAIKAVRELLWHNGFRPMPVYNPDHADRERAGKAPLGKDWEKRARQTPPECIAIGSVVTWATNTGILCDGLRAIDLDIDEQPLVALVSQLAVNMLGATIIRTRANSPRCLLVYRATTGEPVKLTLVGASHTKDNSCKIEVLGRGQQFVAYGGHPSGAELQWLEGGPTDRALADLPAVSEDQVHAFLNACVPVIEAKPIGAKPAPKPNGQDHDGPATADIQDVAAAMALIPNDNAPDWESWNNVGLAIYAATEGSFAGWKIWSEWSAKNPADDPDYTLERWQHYEKSPPSQTGAGKLFAMVAAVSPGWRQPSKLGKRYTNGEARTPEAPVIPVPPPPPPVDHEEPPPPPPPPADDTVAIVEPPNVPPVGDPDGPGQDPPLPMIIIQKGEIPRMVREAVEAIIKAGVEVYQRHALVRPIEEEYPAADGRTTHSAALLEYTAPTLLKLLSKVAVWMKWNVRRNEYVQDDPPDKLVNVILADRGAWPFPNIRGVLTCPTMRLDGSLLTEPGYDPSSRYYLAFPSNLVMPTIPPAPTRQDAEAYLATLKSLLVKFPFESAVDEAVALCILMTQPLRGAMQCSPLLAVTAKAASTGKSYLVDLASAIALGRPCPVIPPGKDDNETEKGIRTKLLSGTTVFSIDNVHNGINLPLLNMATERTHISIRIFGVLEEIEVENSVVVYQTGNNLPVVDEQVRRTYRCRLDAKTEKPEARPFDVSPIEMVLEDRGKYLAAILGIARAYLTHLAADGAPPLVDGKPMQPVGDSHKTWSKLVREALIWLGCDDPIKSQDITREESDPVAIRLGALVDAWYGAFGIGAMTLAEAAKYATTPPVMMADYQDPQQHAINEAGYFAHKEHQETLLGALREGFAQGKEINTYALGMWMRRFEGRVVDGYRFVRVKTDPKMKHKGSAKWCLEAST